MSFGKIVKGWSCSLATSNEKIPEFFLKIQGKSFAHKFNLHCSIVLIENHYFNVVIIKSHYNQNLINNV